MITLSKIPDTDPLFPGNFITIEGERWKIGAWHTKDGERSVFLTLEDDPRVVARWPYDFLSLIINSK